jgi:hypothetical protein
MNTHNQFQIALKKELSRLELLSKIASPYAPMSERYQRTQKRNQTGKRGLWTLLARAAYSFSIFF